MTTEHKPWEAGELVVIDNRMAWGDKFRRGRITRVNKKFLELEDGSQWDLGAYPYPYPRPKGRFYTGPHLRRPLPADEETFLRQRLSRYIDKDFLGKCDADDMKCLNIAVTTVRDKQVFRDAEKVSAEMLRQNGR